MQITPCVFDDNHFFTVGEGVNDKLVVLYSNENSERIEELTIPANQLENLITALSLHWRGRSK